MVDEGVRRAYLDPGQQAAGFDPGRSGGGAEEYQGQYAGLRDGGAGEGRHG